MKKAVYWGVDSASQATPALIACVEKNYGKPEAWGRYLGDNPSSSEGLTKKEADDLRKKKINIVLIYNHFSDARGYDYAAKYAREAIKLAQALGVPKGVYIFADIEKSYPVNADFLLGWANTLFSSPYQPGIYGNFNVDGKLTKAFAQAAKRERAFEQKVILWVNQPQKGVSAKSYAPSYQPNKPSSSANTFIWQYGIEGKACNVDTDLILQKAVQHLW